MACPVCQGKHGCETCDGKTVLELAVCPLEYVDGDVWQLLQYAELYRRVLPPVTGGALDQAKAFVNAALFVMHETQQYKQRLMGHGDE